MEIGEVFDEIQEAYTEKMIRWVPHYLQLIEKLSSSFIPGWEAVRILDLGSGNGNITATLLPKFASAGFTLVDASDKMLDEARQRFSGLNFTYERALIQEADFPPDYFDLIVASFSLHHLKTNEKKSAMENIFRWLNPGGYFAYADLFINKTDRDHAKFVRSWQRFVIKHSDEADWNYLFNHYNQYDHPDNLSTQLQWLQELNFTEIQVDVLENYWSYIRARK
ncbi:MAG: class I SAM-dependent methyltransferase [Saprospiraceae bacterium]|nr:class I SAM-dependent methyltransferase [Saprospiraceae bacterium]